MNVPRTTALPGLRLRSNACLLLLVAGLCLGVATPAARAQRVNFTGSYKITKVTELRDDVELTIVLTLHNSSGRDVKNSGVVLYNSEPNPSAVGSFDLIELLPGSKETTVRHTFTVPKSEYAHWQWGINPRLDLLTPDGRGGTVAQTLSLTRDASPNKTAN